MVSATESEVERLTHYMRDLSAPRDEVRRCVEGLSQGGLRKYGYDYYYLNLRAILPLATPEIVADKAMLALKHKLWGGWDMSNRTRTLMESKADPQPQLSGWKLDEIEALLRRRSGVIVCTMHFGRFRDISGDLAAHGFAVTLAVDHASAIKLRDLLRRSGAAMAADGAAAIGRSRFNVVDVESDRWATVRLAKALQRNELVVVILDGNSGLDGVRGSTNRSRVRFLGFDAHVKLGVLDLARSTGSGLLPVAAYERSGETRVDMAEALFGDALTSDAMQRLYASFEHWIVEHPEQWEGVGRFHQWRMCRHTTGHGRDSSEADVERAADTIRRACEVRLDRNRVALLPRRGQTHLIDVVTLVAYRIASDERLGELVGSGVLDTSRLRGVDEKADSALLKVLARWLQIGLIRAEVDGRPNV